MFGSGADWLEEHVLSAAVVGWVDHDWSADPIRAWFTAMWLLTAVWFVLGLVVPDLRTFWMLWV